MGNSLWRAPREATTGWTEETVGNSLRRDGSDDRVDGRETVGNSLVKVPWGRSEMEATTGWSEEKPWEIAWGELRGKGARWKRRPGGRKGNLGK